MSKERALQAHVTVRMSLIYIHVENIIPATPTLLLYYIAHVVLDNNHRARNSEIM